MSGEIHLSAKNLCEARGQLSPGAVLRAGKDRESWEREDTESDHVPNEYIYLFKEFPTWLYLECSANDREMLSFSILFKILGIHAG